MIDSKLVGGGRSPIVTHTITPQNLGELLDLYIQHQPGRIDATLEKRGFIKKEAAQALELTDEVAIKHVLQVTASGVLLPALVKAGISVYDLISYGAKPPASPAPPSVHRSSVVALLGMSSHAEIIGMLRDAGHVNSANKGYMVSVSGGRAPVVVHHQRNTADSEADRLARTNPGSTVTLLEIVDQRKATVVPAEYTITKS